MQLTAKQPLGNSVTADPGTTMAAASAPEISRDWRLVALIGCVCFPASFALFHYVVPLGAWVAAAPELLVSALCAGPVSYTHLRAHETVLDLVCRLLLEKK